MKMKKTIIVTTLFLIALFLAACQPSPPSVPDSQGAGTYEEYEFDFDKEVETKQFKSKNELLTFLQESSSGGNDIYQYKSTGLNRMIESVADVAISAPAAEMQESGVGGGNLDYSETNIQVEGVDEADIIKTDGNYIYTISDSILYIIEAYPGEDAEIISTIKFDSNPSSLFINGDKLAVFGNFYDYDYMEKIGYSSYYNSMSYFNIYDISDRDDPELEKEYKFEGGYFRGRMIGDNVYFVTTSSPQYNIDRPIPLIIEGDEMREIPISNIYYYDIRYNYPTYVNIHSINLADTSENVGSASLVVEGSQNMYMSENNIYMTYTEYISEYELEKQITMELLESNLSQYEIELIEKIKKTDNDVLTQYEKESKIWQVYDVHLRRMDRDEQEELRDEAEILLKKKLNETKYLEFTVIHKVEVDGEDIEPVANGKVPGHVINQFSMDEHNDVLRIATTVSARWSRFDSSRSESTNNIYTLDEDLEVMDEMEKIAEGEQIYSTRFIGGRLYMVTFRQIDPFFVIDLSNPYKIKKLGELKIPGFSRYLHPYDEDTIIGIGQEATETGRTTGLKISLFDVSDVTDPEEIAKYVTEERYASSSALYEHKAFLFSKEKNLLVIPAYSYDYYDSGDSYNGAFVFNIEKDEIELRGLIDHSSSTDYYWQPAVERSLYIEELLYTKSNKLLRINKIEDLSKVKNIELNEPTTKIPIY